MFDYQKVRLISRTVPNSISFVEENGNYKEDYRTHTAEELIAYCARVSNPSNQTNFETAGKLLKYLMKNGHYSPFEMVNIVMEINTTRDIGRQILRHRSFHFQEFSQRYTEVPEDMFIKTREPRLQDKKNRQNSIETDEVDCDWYWMQDKHVKDSLHRYKTAIDAGIAKEQARSFLPEGLTMSRLYMNGTLRDWYFYCQVRNDPGVTQKEHVDIAQKAWTILKQEFKFLEELE